MDTLENLASKASVLSPILDDKLETGRDFEIHFHDRTLLTPALRSAANYLLTSPAARLVSGPVFVGFSKPLRFLSDAVEKFQLRSERYPDVVAVLTTDDREGFLLMWNSGEEILAELVTGAGLYDVISETALGRLVTDEDDHVDVEDGLLTLMADFEQVISGVLVKERSLSEMVSRDYEREEFVDANPACALN